MAIDGRGALNASQAGPNARGDSITDRVVEAGIVRVLKSKYKLDERAIQAIQLLIGLRGQADADVPLPYAAMRRQDFDSLLRVKAMTSKPLTAAPTLDDYTRLRNDVRMLFEALGLVAQVLGNGDAN